MKTKLNLLVLFFLAFSFSAMGQASKCECIDGISSAKGDIPAFTVNFDNGTIVSVCGVQIRRVSDDKALMSEFNVFDCATGKALLTYDATQTCIVEKTGEGFVITEYQNLPAGENWQYTDVKIRVQKVYLDGEEIVVTEPEPAFKHRDISPSVISKFMLSLNKQKGKGGIPNPEEVIGKLQFLAMNGDQEAYDILTNFEKYFNLTADGAVAEQLKDAVATAEWMKKAISKE